MSGKPLEVGEIGVLQHLNRSALNGLIAEVTGELTQRMLYSLSNPADSEICPAYKVRVPGHPQVHERIEWCVKAHQLRRIDDFNHNNEDGNHSEVHCKRRTARILTKDGITYVIYP